MCKDIRTKAKHARFRVAHRDKIANKRYDIVCQGCGQSAQVKDPRSKFCTHECASRSKIKQHEPVPYWMDVLLDANEYVLVYHPTHPKASNRGYVYEHRAIVEQLLGRMLSAEEIVHHRNGKRWDNRPVNLEVMSKSDHAKLCGQREEDLTI
jgi:flagellar basal body rod protein FlgC